MLDAKWRCNWNNNKYFLGALFNFSVAFVVEIFHIKVINSELAFKFSIIISLRQFGFYQRIWNLIISSNLARFFDICALVKCQSVVAYSRIVWSCFVVVQRKTVTSRSFIFLFLKKVEINKNHKIMKQIIWHLTIQLFNSSADIWHIVEVALLLEKILGHCFDIRNIWFCLHNKK